MSLEELSFFLNGLNYQFVGPMMDSWRAISSNTNIATDDMTRFHHQRIKTQFSHHPHHLLSSLPLTHLFYCHELTRGPHMHVTKLQTHFPINNSISPFLFIFFSFSFLLFPLSLFLPLSPLGRRRLLLLPPPFLSLLFSSFSPLPYYLSLYLNGGARTILKVAPTCQNMGPPLPVVLYHF